MVGGGASSVMVAVPVAVVTVAPLVGLDRPTVNCSVASLVVSLLMGTEMVSVWLADADGLNVRVPVVAVKSGVPGPPATDTAVPSAVAKSTLIGRAVGPV